MNARQESWSAPEELREYVRLVSILDDENWHDDVKALEVELGSPIVPSGGQSTYVAARGALDAALVEAIAVARDAGVSVRQLSDLRGWLSHNDVAELVARTKRPSSSDVGSGWPQRAVLRAVAPEVQVLMESDAASALRLARSARSFLRLWSERVPSAPPPEQVQRLTAQHRSALFDAWAHARDQLLVEIEALGRQA